MRVVFAQWCSVALALQLDTAPPYNIHRRHEIMYRLAIFKGMHSVPRRLAL